MTQDEVFKKAAPLIARLVLEHRAKKAAEGSGTPSCISDSRPGGTRGSASSRGAA